MALDWRSEDGGDDDVAQHKRKLFSAVVPFLAYSFLINVKRSSRSVSFVSSPFTVQSYWREESDVKHVRKW